MSDMSVFYNKHVEDGLSYYIFPAGYPLFKALKSFRNAKDLILVLNSGTPYFFGLKNMDANYIESYEEEYGIIFEYETTQELKLLALDDKHTQKKLYASAPPNIKTILEENYGYFSGIRNSVADKDRELSNYLCREGYQGYAIHTMKTDFEGTFHPELLICNAVDYVRVIDNGDNGLITTHDKAKIIIADQLQKDISKRLEEDRRKKRKGFFEYDGEIDTPKKRSLPQLGLFDSPPQTPTRYLQRSLLFNTPGGFNKRKTNKRKAKKNKKRKSKKRI
jgi:hypothetical protein